MKAQHLLILRDALDYQLSYRPGNENGIFLRDIAHFKLQYALRKNLELLNGEANLITKAVANLKTDEERNAAIESAGDIKITFHNIDMESIPPDARIDASGTWVLLHFLRED